MYLTRMHLNPARRGARSLVASPHRMHAAVMAGFAPDSPTVSGDQRVLWRLENSTPTTLYISSPTAPDLTHVVEQAGWPTAAQSWQTVDTRPLLDRLAADQEWVFRLTANPVHSKRGPSGGRGKRLAHVTVAQQEEWLRTRANAAGFEPLKAEVVRRRTEVFRRGSQYVTISMATYDGVLRVTEPTAFRHALGAGLGRAKGYGCGLITLAPLQ